MNCLVSVIQAYQDVFDTLTTLMDRASVFFERLSMYWEQQQDVKLDKTLRPKIYRVLADFVEIMTQTYRLTDGWKGRGRKFKLALFGETDEVTKLLDKFEMHVADVTDQTVSQIHLQLSKAALDLCNVQQELHDFRLEQAAANKGIQSSMQQHGATLVQVKSHLDDKKDNDQLREKLGIKDEHDFSWKIHNERFTDSVHGSSSWLSDVLKDWEDVRTTNQAEHSILGLVGPENFGKSYLCHQIINRIGRLNIKSSIAWYYVQKEKRTSVHEAIKHIIWQFARTEQTFLDYIKPLTKDFKPGEAGDLAKIWQDLVMGYSKKKPHTVFFVVIDGIDQFDKTSSADVLSEILLSVRRSANEFEGLRVRLLLSGREESFQDLESSHTSSFQKIDLRPTGGGAYLQEGVIKQMITRKLDKIFKGELSDEDSKLRSRIEEILLNVDKGNFDTIKRLLGDIAQCNLPSQMEKVMQEAMRGSEERLKEDINILNKQLLGPEIDQLNLLLRWLAAAKESTNSDSDILRSILSLSFRVDVLRDPVDFLRRNCSTLLNMDNEMITLPQEVLDALEVVKSERETLEESEIRLIESIVRVHFERTFGNREVYDKFEFPAFFGSKANVQSTLVHVPKQQERELNALDLCLKAICDLHDSDQHKDLRNYAAEYFDEHLVQAKLLDVESLVRQQVGRRLWRVLRDEYVLDVWVDRDRMWGMMYWFSVNSQVCQTIVSWMQDKEVQIGLQSVTTERDWLQDVVADGTSEFKALEYVGRHILRRWSESSDDLEWERLLWLRLYHQKVRSDIALVNHSSLTFTDDQIRRTRARMGLHSKTPVCSGAAESGDLG